MDPKDSAPPRPLETLDDIPALSGKPAASPPPTPGSDESTKNATKSRAKDEAKAKGKDQTKATAALPGRVTATRRLVLAVALVLGTVGAALPALFLFWLVFALLATGATAEALEQTGGLVPTTFGGGYALALGLDLVAVLWTLARRFLHRPAPWWPLTALVLLYALVIWVLVPLDLGGLFDVPDMITASALLGADAMLRYVLPFVLMAVLSWSMGSAWRAGRISPAVAGRATAVAGCLGIAGITVAGAVIAAGDRGYFDALAADMDALAMPASVSAEGERQSYEELAAELGPPTPTRYAAAAAGSDGGDRFASCAERLADAREDGSGRAGSERPVVEAATARLIRAGLHKPEAEDVALLALLEVCQEEHERGEPGNVVTRFHERLDQEPQGKQGSRGRATSTMTLAQRDALHATLAALKPADQLVLEMRYIDNLSHERVGTRLGHSETEARLRARRALDRLQQTWQQATRAR